MSWEFEDLSKKVSQGGADVEKSLEKIAAAADKADKAESRLSSTQKSALAIQEKFSKSLQVTAKGMSVVGKEGAKASKSMAALGMGVGTVSVGFGRASKEVLSFGSQLGKTNREVAGMVTEVAGLGKALKAITAKDITIKLNTGGLTDTKQLLAATEKLRKLALKFGKETEKVQKKEDKATTKEVKAGVKVRKGMTAERKEMEKMRKLADAEAKRKRRDKGPDKGAGKGGSGGETAKKVKDWGEAFEKQGKKVEDQMTVLEDRVDDLTSRERYVTLALKAKKLDVINDFKSSLSEAQQEAVATRIALGDVEGVAADLAGMSKVFEVKLVRGLAAAKQATDGLFDSSARLDKELEKQSRTVGDLIKKSFVAGKKEALDFAGGLGKSATGMLAAGVAAYYLFTKLGEVAKEFDASVGALATFNVESAALGATISQKTGPSLGDMRSQLSLTKQQAGDFFAVVKDGVNVLGLSRESMLDMASALQATFGGDPTKRLKEYVDLLKEIPTLDADLKISASPDDQAAALFALAKSGKVEVAMEAQMAGLGGADKAGKPLDGAKMLNAQQKTQYWAEKTGEVLTSKMYPEWGPYLSGAAEGVTRLVAGVAGVVGAVGALGMFMGVRQAATTAAVWKNIGATQKGARDIVRAILSSGRPGRGRLPRGLPKRGPGGRFLPRSVPKMPGGTGWMAKAADAVKGRFLPAVMEAGKKTLQWVKALSTATKVLSVAAIAAVAVGAAARWLSKKFEEAGSEVGAGAADIVASIVDIVGWSLAGALVGSFFAPPLGTAIGAVAGAIIGMVVEFADLGKASQRFGKALQAEVKGFDDEPIKKFNMAINVVGIMFQSVGDAMEWVKDGLWEVVKAAWDFATPIGVITTLWDKFGSSIMKTFVYTDEYNNYLERVAKTTEVLDKAFDRMVKAEEKAKKELAGFQKRTMESGLALQRSMEGIEQAVKNAKLALFDFRKEVSMTDVETLSGLGGSAEVFMSSLGSASDEARDKLKMVTRGLAAMESEILNDAKKLPAERRSALEKLHQEEMKAAKEFADGIAKVVEALYKTPQLVEAGLKRETAKVKGEAFAGAGGMRPEMLDEMARDMVAAADKADKEVEKGREGAAKEAARLTEEETKAREEGQKRVLAMYSKANSAEKRRLSGLVKDTASGPQIRSQEELAKAYGDSTSKVKDLQKQEEQLRSKLPEFFTDAAKAMGEAQKNIEQKKKDVKTVKDVSWKFTDLTTVEGVSRSFTDAGAAEKRLKAAEDERKLNQEIAEEEKKVAAASQQVVAAMRHNFPNIDQKVSAEKLARFAAAKLATEGKMTQAQNQEWARELGMSAQELENVKRAMDRITDISYGNVAETRKQVEAKQAELRGAQDVANAARDAVGPIDNSVATAEILKKNEEEWAKSMQESADVLKFIAEGEGRALADSKTELSARKAKAALAKKTGGAAKATVALIEQENATVKEELRQHGERKTRLEKIMAARKKEEGAAREQVKRAKASGQPTDDLEKALSRLEARTKQVEAEIGNLDDKMGEAAARLPAVGDIIDKTMTELEGSVEMGAAKVRKDFGDAMADLAPYTEDVGKYAEKSFAAAAEGARMEYELKKDALDRSYKAEEEAADRRIAEATTPEGKAFAMAQKDTMQAKKRTDYAKVETALKKDVSEAAKRSMELKMGELELAEGAVSTAMEIAEAFDGSAGVVGPLLEKQMQIERDRLRELKKAAAKSREISGNSLETRKMELDVVKKEAELKKKDLDNARKVIELRRKEVEIVEDVLQSEMDYLQEIGGSFGRIVELQGEILGMERQKVGFAREELDAAQARGAEGRELLEAQAKVRKAELDYSKKAMGAQKSIMDKMLGAAFGGLSDVGARRGVGSDRALLGIEGTRVVTPGGLMMGTGGGAPGTIEERMARAQFSAGAGGGGMAGLIGGGPKKLKMEEQLARNTEDTAKSTGDLARAGLKKKSIYTADVQSVSVLKSILSVLKGIAGSFSKTGDAAKGFQPLGDVAAKEEGKALEDAAESLEGAADSIERQSAGMGAEDAAKDLDSQLKLAKKEFKIARENLALAKKGGRSSKKEVAAAQVAASKLTGLESLVRKKEMENPFAGMAASIDDYDRVMAGRVAPGIEDLYKESADGNRQQKSTVADNKKAVKKRDDIARDMRDLKKNMEDPTVLDVSTPEGEKEYAKRKDDLAKLEREYAEADKEVKATGKVQETKAADVAKKGKKSRMGERLGGGATGLGMRVGLAAAGLGKRLAGAAKGLGEVPGLKAAASMTGVTGKTRGATPATMAGRSGGAYSGVMAPSGGVPGDITSGSMSPVSPVGGAGAASASAETESVTVKGEINVVFNDKMFEAKVTTLVANIIRQPQNLKALSNLGFANVRNI